MSIMCILLSIITLAKIPTYPLHFWLPEAHVEATWVGSVVLACILLKYSLYSCLMFLTWSSFASTTMIVFIVVAFSTVIATMHISVSSDLKKVGAYLSILHMNTGLYVIASSGQLVSVATDML
jgi:NADH-quinone oxidoreductase subunit M